MKAILVVDLPKSCGRCPVVAFKTDHFECQWRYIDNADIVQDWCPLKPMPEKKERESWGDNEYAIYNNLHKMGWNDCLKEIEK